MQALVYKEPWNVKLEEKLKPEGVDGDEVLVSIRATGICGTDIGIVSGLYGAHRDVTLGHESSGVVEAVGKRVRTLKVQDRVMIDPTYFCGFCLMCRTSRSNHCEYKIGTETGVSRDGTFTSYYKTSERFLYRMSNDISHDAATLTEPLSCALTGVNQIRTRSDLRTVVLGAGPMGILYTHALSTKGIGGALVDLSPARLELAAKITGPRWQCRGISLDDVIRFLSPKRRQLDLVVDTTGVLACEAIPFLARGGQFLAVGLRPHTSNIDMQRVADESLSISGSIDSLGTFSTAAHLINTGVIPAEAIVTHRLPLQDYQQGFQLLGCDVTGQQNGSSPKSIKVVLNP